MSLSSPKMRSPPADVQSLHSTADSDLVFTRGVSLDSAHKNPGGAPIEDESPMGKEFGWWSLVLLNFSTIIGTGIFSTPGTVLKQTGSVGLSLVYWAIGFMIAVAGTAYYIELGAAFPNRGGGDVAYFEQMYKRPKFLFPVTFAITYILLHFNAGNCIVFAQYVMYSRGVVKPNDWALRGIAVGCYAVICLCVLFSTKWSLRASNVMSVVKVITLLFIVVTGWVVLAGGTKVNNSHSHFSKPFVGSKSDANDLANALVNMHFAYGGWGNINSLMNEIGGNRVQRLKSAGFVSLFMIFFLYLFANIAYFAAIPIAEAKTSGQLIAGMFFTKVFGEYAGTRVLPVLIALSAFGNLLATTISQARTIREIARQGVIPFGAFFSSTKPFGTPGPALLLRFVVVSVVIIAPPAGDAFNFWISLQSYPTRVFDVLLVIGVWILRRQRRRAGAARVEFEAWNIALVFSIISCMLILTMPWVPPKTGRYGGNVSFWYGTASATGVGILVLCFIYWYVWARTLPSILGYTIGEEIKKGKNGELSKRFVRVFNDERGDEWRRQRERRADDEDEDDKDSEPSPQHDDGDQFRIRPHEETHA